MKFQPEIMVLPDIEVVARETAERFAKSAQQAIKKHGRFTVVLAGGTTPIRAYSLLATPKYSKEIQWDKVYVFWGDERFVEVSDPESNYAIAYSNLLSKVPIPERNIFRIRTFSDDVEADAKEYEMTLKSFFKGNPKFDLVMLGIGPDGHTASLFPQHPEVVAPSQKLVAAVFDAPKLPSTRITLTLKALNNTSETWILVTGNEKASAVKEIFEGKENIGKWPAQGIKPKSGRLIWLLDQAATTLLPKTSLLA